MRITQEKITVIREDDGKLFAIVETDMKRRAQIAHTTKEVGVEEMKDLLEKIVAPEVKTIKKDDSK